jgi:hypothetical protein
MAAVTNFVDDNGRYSNVKPYIYSGPETGLPGTNLVFTEAPLNLTDVREIPEPKEISVKTHGFEFIKHKSKELPNITDEATSQGYALEMAELLTEILGATKVVPLHARVSLSMVGRVTKRSPL